MYNQTHSMNDYNGFIKANLSKAAPFVAIVLLSLLTMRQVLSFTKQIEKSKDSEGLFDKLARNDEYMASTIRINTIIYLLIFALTCQYRNIQHPNQVLDKVLLFSALILLLRLAIVEKNHDNLEKPAFHSILFTMVICIFCIIICGTFIKDIPISDKNLYEAHKGFLIFNTVILISAIFINVMLCACLIIMKAKAVETRFAYVTLILLLIIVLIILLLVLCGIINPEFASSLIDMAIKISVNLIIRNHERNSRKNRKNYNNKSIDMEEIEEDIDDDAFAAEAAPVNDATTAYDASTDMTDAGCARAADLVKQ